MLKFSEQTTFVDLKNRITHGDSRSILGVIPDGSIDLALFDPPYGIDFCSNRTDRNERIVNDGFDDWMVLINWFLPEIKRVLTPTGVACIFCGGGGRVPVTAIFTLEAIKHLELIQTVVWRKFNGLGYRYRPAYENILVLAKDKKKYNFYDTSKKCVNLIEGINQIIPRAGMHPTIKPVELMEKFIKIHSKEGDLVLDPFCGHGSVAVACKNLNRNFICCDIVEEYCRAANDRIL